MYQPHGESISPAILKEAAKCNRDGWGVVGRRLNTNGSPIIASQHGMKMDDFAIQAEKFAGHEAVFHCRIATSGTKDLHNCHPFKIKSQGSPTVWLVHNGNFHSLPRKIDKDKCDSWHFARFLEGIPLLHKRLEDENFLDVLEWMIGNSKVVLFSSAGVIILNEAAGTWREKSWFSNHTAFPIQVSSTKSHAQWFPKRDGYESMYGKWIKGEWVKKGEYIDHIWVQFSDEKIQQLFAEEEAKHAAKTVTPETLVGAEDAGFGASEILIPAHAPVQTALPIIKPATAKESAEVFANEFPDDSGIARILRAAEFAENIKTQSTAIRQGRENKLRPQGVTPFTIARQWTQNSVSLNEIEQAWFKYPSKTAAAVQIISKQLRRAYSRLRIKV